MPYTHFIRRDVALDPTSFSAAARDVRVLVDYARDVGIKLAGPTGEGKPEVTDYTIAFNGSAHCGHRYMDLGQPLPSPTWAGLYGVETTTQPIAEDEPYVSGPYLVTRVCGGNCAGGPFCLDREYLRRAWDRPNDEGRFMGFVETAFKPYDLIVTAALVRIKEHLGEQIQITSDGVERGFEDAKRVCRELFGFSAHFELLPQESSKV